MEPEADRDAAGGAPLWMVTFADLMCLLLTFFVLLLSFSNLEVAKFRAISGSVKHAFGAETGIPFPGPAAAHGPQPARDLGPNRVGTETTVARLREIVEEHGLEADARVKVTRRGVALELQGDLVFDSGEARISPEALSMLDGLVELIGDQPGTIDVEGHTDNIPIATAAYPSNWELSAARAGRAVRYLVERGVPPARVRAVGLADSVPIASNETAEGRSRNRRVEFLFLQETRGDP